MIQVLVEALTNHIKQEDPRRGRNPPVNTINLYDSGIKPSIR